MIKVLFICHLLPDFKEDCIKFNLCNNVLEFSVFVWFFLSHSRIVHSVWRRHHYLWSAAILTFTRSSWPLSSEGSITCHTYCDTGQLFIISEDPWHSHLLPSVCQWSCHYLFNDLGPSRPGIEPRSPVCEANVLPLRHRWVVLELWKKQGGGGAFLRAFALHYEGADVQISAATDI